MYASVQAKLQYKRCSSYDVFPSHVEDEERDMMLFKYRADIHTQLSMWKVIRTPHSQHF